jgi:predicted transcriptional regulator of viral defense system
MNITATGALEVLDLFTRGGGMLTARDAARAGVRSVTLTRLLRRGVIERAQRGVYRLVDVGDLPVADGAAEDLLEVQLRAPYARPCLVSALHLHGLTTTRPTVLQFAVPSRHRPPAVDTPAIEIFYFGPRAYGAGLVTVNVRGRILTTYSAEKTLTDLLRYAPKFGRDLYLEGLKKYLKRPQAQVQALIELGQAQGVWRRLSHDLEVLLHDQDH